MAVSGLMEGGEINLFDLAVEHSGAVGRMAMKSPEYQGLNCKITWGLGAKLLPSSSLTTDPKFAILFQL